MSPGIAIDPGLAESAIVFYEARGGSVAPPWGVVPLSCAMYWNTAALGVLEQQGAGRDLAIEVLPGLFGKGTGSDQLKTERWAGRLIQAWHYGQRQASPIASASARCYEIHRATAKAVVTGSSKGTDADVRRAIIGLYGGERAAFGARCKRCRGDGHRGKQRQPCGECGGTGWHVPKGPLHGWAGSHFFAALAVAIAAAEYARRES